MSSDPKDTKQNTIPKQESSPEANLPAEPKLDGSVASVGIDNAGKSLDQLKFYPDNPTHFSHKARFTVKGPSQFYDPCAEASKMSMKCLERNNYDKDMCTEYFKAYKECKQEWMDERKKDRRSGFKW